jgi:hypothetical protein
MSVIDLDITGNKEIQKMARNNLTDMFSAHFSQSAAPQVGNLNKQASAPQQNSQQMNKYAEEVAMNEALNKMAAQAGYDILMQKEAEESYAMSDYMGRLYAQSFMAGFNNKTAELNGSLANAAMKDDGVVGQGTPVATSPAGASPEGIKFLQQALQSKSNAAQPQNFQVPGAIFTTPAGKLV